jgi:tetratricopeptide (TPR) repeat protein
MRFLMAALLGSLLTLHAQDPVIAGGFEHFYNLEYSDAIAVFRKAVAQQPDDPNRRNYLALAIVYGEMLRSGALESELVTGANAFLRRPKMKPSAEDQQVFDATVAKAMALARARLEKNPKDTGALYALGVSYGLRSGFNWLVRKAWLDSLRDATQARKLHNRVTEIDPSFTDARLVQGLHDYIVGSLPLMYRLVGFLVGFHGDREGGIAILRKVAAEGRLNRVDAEIHLAVIYRRERRPGNAIPLLKSLIARFPRNYLFRFELAQMYADLGRGDLALAEVDKVEELKTAGVAGFERVSTEKIRYSRGNIQFWYRDYDHALENMKRVAARSQELDLSTGVTAWLRVGQIYDLKGQRSQALEAYRQTIAYAPPSDAAREARQYLATPYRQKNRN